MLNVDRLLQLNMAILVILGALLLGIGHGNVWLPVCASAAAVISLYVTDITGFFAFNRLVANLAAILAAAYSLMNFFQSGSEEQLFAIASLLIYLQMVLLFQRKSARIYWQLLILSLLQVVVAAALNDRFESGMLFLIYMILALSAMTLTYISREQALLVAQARTALTKVSERNRGTGRSDPSLQLTGAPLAVFSSVHRERKTILTILMHSMIMCCGAIVLAAVYFYSIPRTNDMWKGPNAGLRSQVGFSKSIRFNQSGRIAQTDSVAFRASLIDGKTQEPFRLDDPVYFRGMALNVYKVDDGTNTWEYQNIQRGALNPMGRLPLNPQNIVLPRMRVNMDPSAEIVVCSVYPCYATAGTPDAIRFDFGSYACYRGSPDDEPTVEEIEYELAVGGIRDGRQLETIPYLHPLARGYDTPMDATTRAWLCSRYVEHQPYVRELTEQLIRGIPQDDHRRIAEALTSHLLLSGRYQYTLDYTDVEFDRDRDAIEDFLLNHRVGHCEYFASALCMMLRYAGIPARLVVGYNCDNYNTLTKRYVVQDKHAHVWVEAYLGPEQVTQEMIDNGEASAGGAWLRLDPTPASAIERDDEDLFRRAGDALDLAQVLWDDFVFDFNSRRQSAMAYEGLLGRSSLIDRVVRSDSWDEMLTQVSTSLGMEPRDGRVFIQGSLVLFIIVCAVVYWMMRRTRSRSRKGKTRSWRSWLGRVASIVSPRLARWLGGSVLSPLQGETVDFYERLSKLLGQAGYERQPGQTQQEFIEDVTRTAKQDQRWDSLCPVLPRIIDAFYLVRFGGRALPPDQESKIAGWLDQLEEQLKITPASVGNGTS